MLLLGDATRDEDAEVAHGFMHGIDDGLAAGADVVILLVKVADPAERLLRRRDVVALGAEADDRRTDVAQVDPFTGRGDDLAGGETVADEQVVDDPLDLLAVEIDVAAPPLLELEIALGPGVDRRPDVVLLAPQRIGRVQVLEVLDQVPAVELAVGEVTGHHGHPAAAGETAGVAHRILAFHAGPVGQRRPGDDDRAAQLGTGGGDHHDRPTGLAVADDAGLALGIRMQLDDLLEEDRLGMHDVLDGLPGHRFRGKAHKIAGMPGTHRHAKFAVGLEPADAGTVPGARVDHDEGALALVDADTGRRLDADQPVIDRTFQGASVENRFMFKEKHVRHLFGFLSIVLLAAPAHQIPVENGALHGVDHVLAGRPPSLEHGVHARRCVLHGVGCAE